MIENNTQNSKTTIQSVHKALKILKTIMYSNQDLSIQELHAELGYNVSTLHHQLNTLADEGFVVQNKATKLYGIGLELFIHGMIFSKTSTYLQKMDPILKWSCDQIGETVNLFVERDHEVVCVRGVETNKILKANLQIGRHLPKKNTASGKVFDLFSNRFEEDNSSTYLQGYVTEINEFDDMISAIAVPVFGKDHSVKFALCTIMPSSRAETSNFDAIATVLQQASKNISELL